MPLLCALYCALCSGVEMSSFKLSNNGIVEAKQFDWSEERVAGQRKVYDGIMKGRRREGNK